MTSLTKGALIRVPRGPRLASILVLFALLAACDLPVTSRGLSGIWMSESGQETMVFHPDGRLQILDANGRSAFASTPKLRVQWQAVTEVEPNHLYMVVQLDDRKEKLPIGIFRLDGDTLVIRQATTYERTIGGFSVGISRHEMPKDFSGVVEVFKRVSK